MKMIDAYHIEAWAIPALAILAITAVITLLLCRFVRELRDTGAAWVAIAIMVLFCVTGAVGQINHLFNPRTADPAEQYTVEETSHSIGRHLYYCTVRPEVGHSRELPISFVTYLRLQEGDRVLLYQGKGALGIEYAYVIPIQS